MPRTAPGFGSGTGPKRSAAHRARVKKALERQKKVLDSMTPAHRRKKKNAAVAAKGKTGGAIAGGAVGGAIRKVAKALIRDAGGSAVGSAVQRAGAAYRSDGGKRRKKTGGKRFRSREK